MRCLKGPPPLANGKNMAKQCKTHGSKGNPLSVHSLCGSAAPSKLLVHFCTKAVRNGDFQVNFGFGLWWLHFFPSEMFTGAITFKHYLSSWISNP